MALIDETILREEFPFVIHEDVTEPQLKRSIASAAKRLSSWIGAELYDSVAAEDEEELSERKLILSNAEGHLALHYALLGLNTNLRTHGLVKREQVEGQTVNEYFSPNDVANFSSQYLELAREIAEPYLLSDGTPSTAFEVINGEC